MRRAAWHLRCAAIDGNVDEEKQEVHEVGDATTSWKTAAPKYAGPPGDEAEVEKRFRAVVEVLRSFTVRSRVFPSQWKVECWGPLAVLLPPNSLRKFLLCQGGEFQIQENDRQGWCFVRGPMPVAAIMPLPVGFWTAGISAVSSPPADRSVASLGATASIKAAVAMQPALPGDQPSCSASRSGGAAVVARERGQTLIAATRKEQVGAASAVAARTQLKPPPGLEEEPPPSASEPPAATSGSPHQHDRVWKRRGGGSRQSFSEPRDE